MIHLLYIPSITQLRNLETKVIFLERLPDQLPGKTKGASKQSSCQLSYFILLATTYSITIMMINNMTTILK